MYNDPVPDNLKVGKVKLLGNTIELVIKDFTE